MGTEEQGWPLRGLRLKVLDLDGEAGFYERFGLRVLDRSGDSVTLGAGEVPLLTLTRLDGGTPRPPRTAGLYHFALLLPTEADLGAFLVHAARERFPYVGAGDHLVSQALYFEDPEGNGIEVYADRPRETWQRDGDMIRMATLPVDLDRLAAQATGPWAGFPEGTVLGHMHLNVADLERSQAHYEGLGMRLMASLPSARFLSYDGYHHHLGINLWAGRGVGPVEPGVAGLESFTIARPGVQVDSPDPDGVRVIAPAGAAEPQRLG
jgi:catechol 2,3-dioxygenase